MLPKLRKKLIYLDQMVLSNIGKALDPVARAEKSRDHVFWSDAHQRIERVLKLQLAVFPTSETQRQESLAARYPEVLRRLINQFSQGVRFRYSAVVHRAQLFHALDAVLSGAEVDYSTLRRTRVLQGDPDAWMDRIQVTGEFPRGTTELDSYLAAQARAHQVFAGVFQRWQDEREKTLEERYLHERAAFVELFQAANLSYAAKVLKSAAVADSSPENLIVPPPDVVTFQLLVRKISEAGLSPEESVRSAIAFLNSEDAQRAPQNDIMALLFAGLARKAASGQKQIKASTLNDIGVLSTVFPYVDAIFIDDEFANLIRELRREKKKSLRSVFAYPTKVFSNRNRDEFLQYLDEVANEASDEHRELVAEIYGERWLVPYTEIIDHERRRNPGKKKPL